MDNLALQCRCGLIKGRAIKVNPADGTRVICYCKDCQAFAHALKAGAEVLDEQGGKNRGSDEHFYRIYFHLTQLLQIVHDLKSRDIDRAVA